MRGQVNPKPTGVISHTLWVNGADNQVGRSLALTFNVNDALVGFFQVLFTNIKLYFKAYYRKKLQRTSQ